MKKTEADAPAVAESSDRAATQTIPVTPKKNHYKHFTAAILGGALVIIVSFGVFAAVEKRTQAENFSAKCWDEQSLPIKYNLDYVNNRDIYSTLDYRYSELERKFSNGATHNSGDAMGLCREAMELRKDVELYSGLYGSRGGYYPYPSYPTPYYDQGYDYDQSVPGGDDGMDSWTDQMIPEDPSMQPDSAPWVGVPEVGSYGGGTAKGTQNGMNNTVQPGR